MDDAAATLYLPLGTTYFVPVYNSSQHNYPVHKILPARRRDFLETNSAERKFEVIYAVTDIHQPCAEKILLPKTTLVCFSVQLVQNLRLVMHILYGVLEIFCLLLTRLFGGSLIGQTGARI